MIKNDSTKRLSRLTSVLTLLQSKRLVTATSLAEKFNVSVRTIYRDIRTLEESGVPIITEEGKGYSLVDGYRIPPVMFTEREAYALITVEQIVLKHKDASLVKEFTASIAKLKSVLRSIYKEKIERLERMMFIGKNYDNEVTSQNLIDIQSAIVENRLLDITYNTENNHETRRIIEPYMIYHGVADNWTVVAFCRLRNDFRVFRLDRISSFSVTSQSFKPREIGFKKFLAKKYSEPNP